MSYTGPRAHLRHGKAVAFCETFDVGGGQKLGHDPQHICITANRSSAIMQTDCQLAVCDYARMDSQADAVRAYLAQVCDAMEMDLTNVAREAGLAPSTLTRFQNKPEVKHIPSLRSLSSVSAVSGIPLPPEVTRAPKRNGGSLEQRDKLNELVQQQLSLLNRSWDALYDDERAALVATAKAFIANRRKTA